jgi:hypothetical protein
MRRVGAVGALAVCVCAVWAAQAGADVGSLKDSTGEVVAWGSNYGGHLNIPLGSYKAVSPSRGHSLGILMDDTGIGWGSNGYGEAAVPTGTYQALAVGGNHSLGLRTDGTLAAWGRGSYGLSNAPTGTFTAIAAGGQHNLAIRSDGTLAGWGNNADGQSDVPAGTYKAVAAHQWSSFAIRTDGTLAAWGYNGSGLTDVPTGTFADISVGSYRGLALRTDGDLAQWGEFAWGIPAEVGAYSYTDVGEGTSASVALRADGHLLTWGYVEVFNDWTRETEVVDITPPTGKYVAVAAIPDPKDGDGFMALVARTNYDNLLVNGSGEVTDVASWLNRDITVTGDATIRSTLYPMSELDGISAVTMNVGGQITLESGGGILHQWGTADFNGKFLGQAGSTIASLGDGLDLGTDTSTDGFAHYGSLSAGGLVTLHDADGAVLGGHVNVASVLASTHGITVAAGGVIEGAGGVGPAVFGGLINHGVVQNVMMVNGLVKGDGQFIDVIFTGGTFSPGMSPASLTLTDPTFTGSETLEMELGGLTQGTEYDHLDILGTAHLDGTLSVVLIDGFTPDSGNSFDLFDGTLSGTFDTLYFPTLAQGLYWDWSTLYTDGTIRVEGTVVPVPGAFVLGVLGLTLVRRVVRRRA